MDTQLINSIENEGVKSLFDASPYPNLDLLDPISSTQDGAIGFYQQFSFKHPYYLKNRQLPKSEKITILDAGCGTGATTVALARANPNSKIVAVDFSEKSIDIAKKRVKKQNIPNVKFFVESITNLESISKEFDYIYCLETLYLLPNPLEALISMKNVLAPGGIIRANFHCQYQRASYYRCQKIFKLIGLLDQTPKRWKLEATREFLNSLNDELDFKKAVWTSHSEENKNSDEFLLMNHLFFGDTGCSLDYVFSILEETGLALLSMVDPKSWSLENLFYELPDCLEAFLETATAKEKLYLHELINPNHRLLDFWCYNALEQELSSRGSFNLYEEWKSLLVILPDFLKTEEFKATFADHVGQNEAYQLTESISLSPQIVASCLLPLWEKPRTIVEMIANLQKIRPLNYLTLQPTKEEDVIEEVLGVLSQLVHNDYLYLEFLV